jgi:threonine/homoserine/homoserine lactone efflux protein
MSPSSAFGFGFALAFFNPKIAAFLLAIYSQFVVAGASLATKMGMAAMAFGIDAGWYALVAVILSGKVGSGLAAHSRRIDQLIGVLMLLFAVLFSLRFFTLA